MGERAIAVHGNRQCYKAGCHCDDCRRANSDYQAANRARLRRAALPDTYALRLPAR